jgi:hypothetical protein
VEVGDLGDIKLYIYISNYIYFCQHNFCIDTLYVKCLIQVSAFRPSSGASIHRWLHCSPLELVFSSDRSKLDVTLIFVNLINQLPANKSTVFYTVFLHILT